MNQLYELFHGLDTGVLLYNDCEIRVIIDKYGDPWFNGIDVANSLEYNSARHAVQQMVDREDRIALSKIKYDNKKYNHNVRKNAAYISEGGLYQLILSSKLQTAKQFKRWVANDVIPSIRKYGSYSEKELCKDKMRSLRDKIKYYRSERKKIKNDCMKCEYPSGGMVYAVDVSTKYEKLYRIGTTKSMNLRTQIYNTHTLHNYKVPYFIETTNHFSVESCIKCVLRNYRYVYDKNTKKDIYNCSLNTIKKAFATCVYGVKQTGGSKRSVIKNPRAYFYENIINNQIKSCSNKIPALEAKIKKMDIQIQKKKLLN